ncbi:MAG: VCBS repeat-containing protein, partial [Saprospiraceae bacterium]|nr:VCBS repeat-containing protein [Saprospiraceae bacterium]
MKFNQVLIGLPLLLFACNSADKVEVRKVTDREYSTAADISNETALFTLLSPEETNIDFKNIITENQSFHFKNYAYIYNGSGVAIGDINNDGLQDVFLGGNLVTGKLYLNLGDFKFKDITKTSGLENVTGFRTGVNMIDINTDGFLDIYICAGGLYENDYRKNRLYINNGNSTFTEKSAEYGLDDMSYSTQSFFFDYDNDGDVDLYLLNHPLNPTESNNLLMESDKGGNLKLVLPKNIEFTSDRFYRNDNGKFKEVTEQAGLLNDAFGLSALVADFNDDQFTDIFVCNDYVKPDNLYINNGDGTFTDKFNDFFQHSSFSSMGSDYADINNDGCLDLMTLDMFPEDNYRQKMHGTDYNYDKYLLTKKFNFATQFIKNTLQINNCNGTYSDIAMLTDVAHTDWSWTTLFADYDNDGWKDIFVTNGYRRSVTDNDFVKYTQDSLFKIYKSQFTIDKLTAAVPVHKTASYLYKNNGNLTFSNVSDIWNAGPPEFSNGAVYVDLNNDGYLDIISNNIDEAPFIYKNNGAASRKNNFIRFNLKFEKGKTSLGTKVEISDEKGNTQTQYYYQSRGFLSSVEPVVHFGLGKTSKINEVKVYWPNGKMQLVKDFKINSVNDISYDNKSPKTKVLVNPNVYFENISDVLGKELSHIENEFIDFKREPLLHRKYSDEGPALAVGDINEDGLDDFYLGGSTGYPGKLFIQKTNGGFELKENPDFVADKIHEDVNAVFVDVNKDKHLDLIVVSGGNEFPLNSINYEDRLYLNDGKGNLKRAQGALPAVLSSGSALALNDIDNDGDPDLFVGGRISSGQYPLAPMSYLARNDNGKFVNVTPSWSEGLFKIGMVTSATFEDLDKDGVKELILCGEWLPISIFKFEGGKYKNVTASFGLDKNIGWWETIHVRDLNGDGYPEIIAGNVGLNTHMKSSNEKPVTLHYKDYDGNSTLDPLLCYY